jgi:hypothetical protein
MILVLIKMFLISFSITFLLLFYCFYFNLFRVLWICVIYAISALTLIWEQDPEERLGEDLTINSMDIKDIDSLTVITMEVWKII